MGKTLRDELANDPTGIGLAAMSDSDAAAALHAQTIEVRVPVGVPKLNGYLLETGLWQTLNEVAEQTGTDGDPTAAARAADTLLAASVAPPSAVDLDSVGLTAALDTLQSAGAITAQERSGIDALADATISRAEELGIGHVDWRDVRFQRRFI